MKLYLSLLENCISSKTDEIRRNRGFATSAEVVIKASGLRFEAIRVIAREQGVEIEDSACRCIDESLLAALADAHIRKMRAYFNNALRHIAKLRGDELALFIDFCKTYSKRQTKKRIAESWVDIDADAIQEQFIKKVKETTQPDSDYYSLEEMLSG